MALDQVSKALLLDFFIKASEADEAEARLQEILAHQEEHAVIAWDRMCWNHASMICMRFYYAYGANANVMRGERALLNAV